MEGASKMTEYMIKTPPIDIQEALDRAMGEKEFLVMLLEEFSDGLTAQIEKMRVAIDQQDRATLTQQSHTLKGAAGNLSAKAMAAVVMRLEQAGRSGDFETSSKLMAEMEMEATRLRQYLEKFDWSGLN